MAGFFSAMIYITTILAMAATGVFYVGILLRNESLASEKVFSACDVQIKVCKISSVVFSVLYWFVASGFPSIECLVGYQNLSVICSRLGQIWIVLAFVSIVISIILIIQKEGKPGEVKTMSKLRNSSFIMGAILLVLAFILKVN